MPAKSVAMLTLEAPVPSEVFIYRQARRVPATILTERLWPDRDRPAGVQIRALQGAGRFFRGRSLRGMVGTAVSLVADGVLTTIPRREEDSYVREVSEGGFGIALAHYGVTGIRFLAASRRAGIPLAVHFHGFDLSSMYRSRLYRRATAQLVDYARALIVVNEAQYRRLRELGCPKEKIYRIPYGVPIPDMPVGGLSSDSSGVRFVAVGRFVPKKAPDVTLRAFAASHRRCPGITLDFVGDGPLLGSCRSLASSLGIAGAVTFHGVMPNAFVMNLYSRSSVFVQHSVTADNGDEEGWPVAIAEAMSRGLPVVSTKHAGIVDQVRHGTDGYLVEEGDEAGMTQYMVRLASDTPLREAMGINARERMLDVGDLKQSVAQLRAVLAAAAV